MPRSPRRSRTQRPPSGSSRRPSSSTMSRPRRQTRATSSLRGNRSLARIVNSRIRLLLLCILVSFAALLVRAAWIATVRASTLSAMAQQQATSSIVLPAGRGTIFDSMGVPLALGEQATTIYVDPTEVTRPEYEAYAISRVLHLDPASVYAKL